MDTIKTREIANELLEILKQKRVDVLNTESKMRSAFEDTVVSVRPDLDKDDIFFYLDGWKCEKSPITICVYKLGMGDEECLFCGQPEERK